MTTSEKEAVGSDLSMQLLNTHHFLYHYQAGRIVNMKLKIVFLIYFLKLKLDCFVLFLVIIYLS